MRTLSVRSFNPSVRVLWWYSDGGRGGGSIAVVVGDGGDGGGGHCHFLFIRELYPNYRAGRSLITSTKIISFHFIFSFFYCYYFYLQLSDPYTSVLV